MPDFNVGDRFVFLRDNLDGGGTYGRIGEIGIITRPVNPVDVFDHGQEVYFKFEDPNRLPRTGGEHLVPVRCIQVIGREELVEPEPVDTQTLVRYAVVMQYPGADHPGVNFFTTQASAERLARMVPEGGGIVLATKKIKIVVPVVVFPEMELDEDDFEIEHNEPEEDDGNAF